VLQHYSSVRLLCVSCLRVPPDDAVVVIVVVVAGGAGVAVISGKRKGRGGEGQETTNVKTYA